MNDSISLNVAIALAGMLAGGMLTYGALRQTVSDLKSVVEKLGAKVEALSTQVHELTTAIRIMEAVEEVTARHDAPAPPSRAPRDPRRE